MRLFWLKLRPVLTTISVCVCIVISSNFGSCVHRIAPVLYWWYTQNEKWKAEDLVLKTIKQARLWCIVRANSVSLVAPSSILVVSPNTLYSQVLTCIIWCIEFEHLLILGYLNHETMIFGIVLLLCFTYLWFQVTIDMVRRQYVEIAFLSIIVLGNYLFHQLHLLVIILNMCNPGCKEFMCL